MQTISIPYFTRNVYGTPRYYPLDPMQKEALALLTNQKTMTKAHMRGLQQLGFQLTEVLDPELSKLTANA